jgi:hypothetical protein
VSRRGTWTAFETAAASGGSYVYSSGSAEDRLALSFRGAELNVRYVQHPALGSFALEVDGVVLQVVDSRGPEGFAEVSLGLGPGTHTAWLSPVTGTIAFDAFGVEAVLPPPVEPTVEPTPVPTEEPTVEPTPVPTEEPTVEPTPVPTEEPTVEPTPEPTDEPTVEPTPVPTEEPTVEPTPVPTEEPTVEPTPEPTEEPTVEPTEEPTPEATEEPTPDTVVPPNDG